MQRPGLLGEGGLGGPRGLQRLLLPGNDVSAQSGLKVDDQPLEVVAHQEHLCWARRCDSYRSATENSTTANAAAPITASRAPVMSVRGPGRLSPPPRRAHFSEASR